MSAIAEDRLAQKFEALAKAKAYRQRVAADKKLIRDGVLSLELAIEQPEWANYSVHEALCAQKWWGPHRAERLLGQVPISSRKLCGELTARQLGVIADLLEEGRR